MEILEPLEQAEALTPAMELLELTPEVALILNRAMTLTPEVAHRAVEAIVTSKRHWPLLTRTDNTDATDNNIYQVQKVALVNFR